MWTWDGERWTLQGSLPFARSSHGVAYDPVRRSIVLFGGGLRGSFADDPRVWEWRGGSWRVRGEANAGRAEPGLCYDRSRQRLVVFGGWDAQNDLVGHTMEWTGSDMVMMDVAGPPARAGHAFIYDPAGGRCLMFGGRDDRGYLADTWTWDGIEWRRHDVAAPSPRGFFGAAVDEAARRVVIFGGTGTDGGLGDTWAWDGVAWTRITGKGPAPRGMARLAFDGAHVVLFGGRLDTARGLEDRNDTWTLRDTTWVAR